LKEKENYRMRTTLKIWRDVTSVHLLIDTLNERTQAIGFAAALPVVARFFKMKDYTKFQEMIFDWARRLCAGEKRFALSISSSIELVLYVHEDSVEERYIALRFDFIDPKEARVFRKAVEPHAGSLLDPGFYFNLTYDNQALWIQGRTKDDSIFTRGDTVGRLGARLVLDSEPDGNPLYYIAPLPGESLIVYKNLIGLEMSWSPDNLHHPNENIFASVGPLSLQIIRDTRERRLGVRNSDRPDKINAFFDPMLPIKMILSSRKD
jgi:hypothetical protein